MSFKTMFTIILAVAYSSIAYSQTASLSGRIQTPINNNIEAVVMLSGSDGTVLATVNTLCSNGLYQFDNLPTGNTYYIRISKNDGSPSSQPLNGVSTFDMVLNSKFILGITIPTVYQQLAADVDGDGSSSVLDLLAIRRLILGITNGLNVPVWRFVRPNTGDALESFPVLLQGDLTGFDFIGVKTGDLNYSATGCQ